jgi:hypothetical protein
MTASLFYSTGSCNRLSRDRSGARDTGQHMVVLNPLVSLCAGGGIHVACASDNQTNVGENSEGRSV